MATVAESSESETPPAPGNHSTTINSQTLDETTPFIDYAVGQALLYQKAFNDAVESAIDASKSRFSQIRLTSSAHFHQTLHSLDDLKSQYNAYEDLLFGKIKEGVLVAASHPLITCGATVALGLLVLKRPRRILYYNTKRLFVSEESLISRASAEVKELRQSIDLLKAESEKLEKSALHAEEQLLHGRTKLRQAGKQIRNVIHSAYKIERRAGGLKDILGELPKREASHFRSQQGEMLRLIGGLIVKFLIKSMEVDRCLITIVMTKLTGLGTMIVCAHTPPPSNARIYHHHLCHESTCHEIHMVEESMIDLILSRYSEILRALFLVMCCSKVKLMSFHMHVSMEEINLFPYLPGMSAADDSSE
ncbi:hypothetical protein SESBI_07508 [Sesbania bispinosa]|nr:hypothetical protein SESBI_07508 [Sesbania bispinosa]